MLKTCVLNKKLSKLSMTLKPYECIPVFFESVGNIVPRYTGRIRVTLTKLSYKGIKLSAGDIVGYIVGSIVLQPVSLK